MTIKIPHELKTWLDERCDSYAKSGSVWPVTDSLRQYVLCSVPLNSLSFNDHKYNPRTPDQKKVNTLKSSIQMMGLFSPLTCAYLEKYGEIIALIDGRHRFQALLDMKEEDKVWADKVKIDMKIYFGLKPSDLHAMATYLNKTRQKLKKGEYYRSIVNIYDERKEEIESAEGKTPSEEKIIETIEGVEFQDKTIDFTIGRIVGMVAFNYEEEGSWYPFIGLGQREKLFFDKHMKLAKRLGFNEFSVIYKPLTAGSFADFLAPLCYSRPYNDYGEKRSVEIGNVTFLGEIFADIFFKKDLLIEVKPGEKKFTATSVGSKYWCIVALGNLMRELESEIKKKDPNAESIMACIEPNWDLIKKIFTTYLNSMEKQAEFVEKYRSLKEQNATLEEQDVALNKAWSYYTQRDKVMNPLRDEFKKRGLPFPNKV